MATLELTQPSDRGSQDDDVRSEDFSTQFRPVIAIAFVGRHSRFDVEVDNSDDLPVTVAAVLQNFLKSLSVDEVAPPRFSAIQGQGSQGHQDLRNGK